MMMEKLKEDLIYRNNNKLMNMDKDINIHIEDVFDNVIFGHLLHELKLSYKYLYQFVIDKKIQNSISNVFMKK